MRRAFESCMVAVTLLACGGGDDADTNTTSPGGSAGASNGAAGQSAAGRGGATQAGSGGSSGQSAGSSGASGTSGGAGKSGSSGMGGTAGTAGNAGTGGNAGTSGASGMSGNAGAGGNAGTSGNAGSSGASGSAGAAGGVCAWGTPSCTSVSGSGAVSFSFDEGKSRAPLETNLTGTSYTFGLVALATPGHLLAASAGRLLRSTDAGCTWNDVGDLAGAIPRLVTNGDVTYAFQDNGDYFARIEGTTIKQLKPPFANVIGLAVDAKDSQHLRAGGGGRLWESTNGGGSWDQLGDIVTDGSLDYRFAFDPNDLNHVLVGSATAGGRVTFDGGKSWNKSAGLSASGKANLFNIAVSSVNGDIVWGEGIDLDENLANAPGEGRHVYRSEDGGRSFTPVVGKTADIVLYNGNYLVPHPTERNVLYFTFGTFFQGYGTDIYRYDHTTGLVTKGHDDAHRVDAIAFAPGCAGTMYIGRSVEQVQ